MAETTAETTNRLSRLLTRLGKYTAFSCVVGFVALMAVGFSVQEPTAHYHLIAVAVAFALLSGIACVGSYFVRELLEWKKHRWRYGIRHLISWMTVIALVLTMLMYAISGH